MRNCDYYKTPEELRKAFRKICTEIEAQDKCNERDCAFFGENYSDCIMNFTYAEYDAQLLDKLILKPCANCGGTAVLRKCSDSEKHWVECEKCRIQTAFGTRDEVIEKWNRRIEK